MNSEKKPTKKRKLPSSPSSTRLQVGRRLRAFRSGQRNLWDDEEESDNELYVQSKKVPVNNKTYIVLSDSDDEKPLSKQISKTNKLKKKTSRTFDENLPSDDEHKHGSKCVTCLICSILSTLNSYNCCTKHLSLLFPKKDNHDNYEKKTTNMTSWPTKQVMIVPMTDDFIQRYINQPAVYQMKTSPVDDKSLTSNKLTRTLSKKSRLTSESSDSEQLPIRKLKPSVQSSRIDCEQPSSSSVVFETAHSKSDKIAQDITFTVVSSSSSSMTTTNSFESPNILDTCQLQQSSDQPIVIGDTQPDSQQVNPWEPISEDIDASLDPIVRPTSTSSQKKQEFSPKTARRTPTDLMASRLPKIQLKKGRFCQGKPIIDKVTPDTTTKDCQSSTTSQPSSSTSMSMIIINHRGAPVLETIVEDESLVIQSTHHTSDKVSHSCHGLSQKYDTTTEGLSDTVMSGLFAQEESADHDLVHSATRIISSETALPSVPAIVVEDYSNRSAQLSQLSQLTNDQCDSQLITSLITNEKQPRLAKKSYRMNPDGSRISILRTVSSPLHEPSSSSSHQASTDGQSS